MANPAMLNQARLAVIARQRLTRAPLTFKSFIFVCSHAWLMDNKAAYHRGGARQIQYIVPIA